MIEPRSLRLQTRAESFRTPRPPFGLAVWREDGDAVAILIDADRVAPAGVAAVAEQVPPAATLPPGTTVVVLGAAAAPRGFWRRIFGRRPATLPRTLRCTALLVRGYVDVGAGRDGVSGADLAWGRCPDA